MHSKWIDSMLLHMDLIDRVRWIKKFTRLLPALIHIKKRVLDYHFQMSALLANKYLVN